MRSEKTYLMAAETGSVTIMVVAFLPVLLLMLGLSIDVGRILASKAELYKACDIAARETARRIDVVEASATGNQKRDVAIDEVEVFIKKNLNTARGMHVVGVTVISTKTHVMVTCRAEVPLLFSGLINRPMSTVTVTGMARVKPYVSSN